MKNFKSIGYFHLEIIAEEIAALQPKTWIYNDAGRSKTKWRGTNDCGVRALSFCTGMPYEKARKYLKAFGAIGYANNRRISHGVYVDDMNLAMESLGWEYIDAKELHLPRKAYHFDIPGLALCNMPRHFAAVKDGIIYDTWDSTERHVIGFWKEIAE